MSVEVLDALAIAQGNSRADRGGPILKGHGTGCPGGRRAHCSGECERLTIRGRVRPRGQRHNRTAVGLVDGLVDGSAGTIVTAVTAVGGGYGAETRR